MQEIRYAIGSPIIRSNGIILKRIVTAMLCAILQAEESGEVQRKAFPHTIVHSDRLGPKVKIGQDSHRIALM